jgi:chitinase
MKKLLSLLAFSPMIISTLGYSLETSNAQYESNNVVAGYVDITALGTSTDLDMAKVRYDGYNEVIIAFANIDGTNISFSENVVDLAQQKNTEAQNAGLKTILSVGGEHNTYNPGNASAKEVAHSIVKFLHKNGYSGIDFDIEIEAHDGDSKYLKDLAANIKKEDAALEIIIAPQIMGDALVSTSTSEFYKDLLSEKGLVDFIYVQNYNTVPEQNPSFTQDAFNITSKYSENSDAKIVLGFPSTASAAGLATVYYPNFNGDYSDKENLPKPSEALNTYEAMKSIFPYLSEITVDQRFAGFMSWSLNADYFGYTFSGDYPDQADGSFGYYMSPCALENKCSKIPKSKIQYRKIDINVYVNKAADFPKINNRFYFGLDSVKFINQFPAADKYDESITTTDWYGPGNGKTVKAYSAPKTTIEVSIQGEKYTCKDTSGVSLNDLTIDTQAVYGGQLIVNASTQSFNPLKIVSCKFIAN